MTTAFDPEDTDHFLRILISVYVFWKADRRLSGHPHCARLRVGNSRAIFSLRSLSRLTSFQIIYSIFYFSPFTSILKYFLIFTFVRIGQVLWSNAADGGKRREFVISTPQNRGLDKLPPPSRDLPLVSPEW